MTIVPIVEHSAYRPTGFIEPVFPLTRCETHQNPMMPSPTLAIVNRATTGVSDRGCVRPSAPRKEPASTTVKEHARWELTPATRVASTETMPAIQARAAAAPDVFVRHGEERYGRTPDR